MQTRTPEYVVLNNRRVKVQQWQLRVDRVLLTTLVRGDTAGIELVDQLQADTVMLAWDDGDPIAVRPELTRHRAAGSGPATVHRIEVTLWFSDVAPGAIAPLLPPDDKLDRILHEIQLLRAEVAELRQQRWQPAPPAAPPLAAGRTLLDFDIDTDDSA